jgi:hypothetical protein
VSKAQTILIVGGTSPVSFSIHSAAEIFLPAQNVALVAAQMQSASIVLKTGEIAVPLRLSQVSNNLNPLLVSRTSLFAIANIMFVSPPFVWCNFTIATACYYVN